jgi:hypothetical protein
MLALLVALATAQEIPEQVMELAPTLQPGADAALFDKCELRATGDAPSIMMPLQRFYMCPKDVALVTVFVGPIGVTGEMLMEQMTGEAMAQISATRRDETVRWEGAEAPAVVLDKDAKKSYGVITAVTAGEITQGAVCMSKKASKTVVDWCLQAIPAAIAPPAEPPPMPLPDLAPLNAGEPTSVEDALPAEGEAPEEAPEAP